MNANTTRNKIPFFYSVLSAAMANAGTDSKTLVLAADSQFELCYLMGNSTSDDPNDPQSNNFNARITDQSTGRLLMNDFIPQSILCGPANGTIYQKYGVIFDPLANLLIEWNNLSGESNTARLVFVGYKIFTTIQG